MRSYPTLLAALTALAAACSRGVDVPLAPSGAVLAPLTHPVTVALDRESYTAGESLTLRIANHDTADLAFSICPGLWSRTEGDELPAERIEELALCTAAFTPLPAGATLTETVQIPPGFGGMYSRHVRIYDPVRNEVQETATTFVWIAAERKAPDGGG